MSTTTQFAMKVLAHDPTAPTKIACYLDMPAANDDNWQKELDNDPGYLVWLEECAEAEEMRHARW